MAQAERKAEKMEILKINALRCAWTAAAAATVLAGIALAGAALAAGAGFMMWSIDLLINSPWTFALLAAGLLAAVPALWLLAIKVGEALDRIEARRERRLERERLDARREELRMERKRRDARQAQREQAMAAQAKFGQCVAAHFHDHNHF